MDFYKRYFFLFLLAISFLSESYGQEKIYFERIEKEGGIQLGHIFDLFEGSEGFMWFCTSSGLVKYDGFQFKYFRHNAKDSTSLSSSWIHTGFEDSKGRFWIGTGNGLNIMDRRTEKFRPFFHQKEDSTSLPHNGIRDVIEDAQHRIWIGTVKGVCFYDEEKNIFHRVTMPSFSGFRHNPKLFEDSQGNIWVSAIEGVFRIDPEKMTAKHFSPEGVAPNLAPGSYACWEDETGKIWVSTKNGIWIFNPLDESFFQLPLPKEIIDNSYNALVEYPKGFLMLGSFNDGLISWDLKKNKLHRRYKHNPLDREGPINISTYSLAKDRVGNLWIGTFNGINKINPQAEKFHLYENAVGSEDLKNYVLNVNEDQYGGIWINSRAGLFYKKSVDVPSESFSSESIKLNEFNGILNVFVDEQKKIWVARRSFGLYGYDQARQTSIFVDTGEKENQSFCAIYGDDKNPALLWLSNKKGLLKYNKKTGERNWFYPKEQLSAIPSNRMTQVTENSDGNLWGKVSGGGIVFFDKMLGKFKYYAPNTSDSTSILPGNVINIALASNGLWAATGKGLSFLKNGTTTFSNYYKNDTLFKYGIASMTVDDEDNVWISDGNGVSKFDPKAEKFTSYYCMDKAQDFINGVVTKSKSGQIYFGTAKGLLVFHPDSIAIDTITPKVVLTEFKVNNEPFKFNTAIEFVDSIFLTSEAKIFTFEYASLYFKNTKKNKFKIKLEGFDTDWREVGAKRDATYTNIQPGEYTFSILSANADGVWSNYPLSVKLFILPPYWQTNWFYTLIGLVFCSILYIIYRAKQHTQQLKEAKIIAEQSSKYKSQFLSNMSHEIRTPMNAIVGMSKLMLDTNLNKKQQEYASIVQQSAENLLVIINDILDQSKIESGQYSFISKAFNLTLLIAQLQRVFNYRIKEKNLEFDVIIEKNVPLQLIGDPTRLNQILMNLVSNAIKFTNEGSIHLSIKNQKESLEDVSLLFSIRDTGVGIDEENLTLIFESFRQLKDTNIIKEQGSGLGLSISKELVQNQGGKIWVESKKGKGSCFYFILRFKKNKEKTILDIPQIPALPILQALNFLIVDDTLFNQILATELLKKAYPNAQIDLANNGQVAVEKVRQQSYDLILMDVKMPVMDGLEASRLIRKMQDTEKRNIPILAVTANVVSEQLDSCKKAGMNDYVTKPIDRKDLILKINDQLKINNLQ